MVDQEVSLVSSVKNCWLTFPNMKSKHSKEAATQGSFCLEEDNPVEGRPRILFPSSAQDENMSGRLCWFCCVEDLFVQKFTIEIDDAMERADPFVKRGILPELVGMWFNKRKTSLMKNKLPSSPIFQL